MAGLVREGTINIVHLSLKFFQLPSQLFVFPFQLMNPVLIPVNNAHLLDMVQVQAVVPLILEILNPKP